MGSVHLASSVVHPIQRISGSSCLLLFARDPLPEGLDSPKRSSGSNGAHLSASGVTSREPSNRCADASWRHSVGDARFYWQFPGATVNA
jgi:hypothetical protein